MADDPPPLAPLAPGELPAAAFELPPLTRWQRIRRGPIPRLVLLLGAGLILVHTFRSRPVEVEVRYEYGRARDGLSGVELVYLQGGEEIHRVRFDYAVHGAPLTQRHTVQLLVGEYEVQLTLRFRETPSPRVRGRQTGRAGELMLRRPLTIHGRGSATVYVAADD